MAGESHGHGLEVVRGRVFLPHVLPPGEKNMVLRVEHEGDAAAGVACTTSCALPSKEFSHKTGKVLLGPDAGRNQVETGLPVTL